MERGTSFEKLNKTHLPLGGDAVAGKGMASFFQGIDTQDSLLLPVLVGSLSSTWQLVGSPSEIMALHVTF